MSQERLFEAPDPEIGDVEEQLRDRGLEMIIGVDEAGRGPLAGPVVAAAFAMDLTAPLPDELEALDDSKKLEVDQRDRLYERLIGGDYRVGVAASDAGVIDEINILQATFRAMREAIDEVAGRLDEAVDAVLVDGQMTIPGGPARQRAIVGGDGRSRAIAAASIAAKVTRDRQMIEAGDEWPAYGFASHKGYPTARHRAAIEEHGPCPLHRRSFSGVESGGDST